MLRLIFDQMHRHLKLKISIAVVVVFVCALLQYVDIPRIHSIVGALRYVTDHNLDLRRTAGNYIPAFKLAWQERKLPDLGLGPAYNRSTGGILPLDGKLEGKFGLRVVPDTGQEEMHYGIDLSAPEGAPVKAVLAGKVEEIFLGEMAGLLVAHGGGWQTIYRGLKTTAVTTGDLVEEGAILGTLGTFGKQEAPTLHFELRYQERPVEPPAEWVKQFENG